MNDFVPQKIGMGFAFGAFGFLVFASLLAGATFITSVIRGFQGALIFGGVAWVVGWLLLRAEANGLQEDEKMENSLEETKTEEKLMNTFENK